MAQHRILDSWIGHTDLLVMIDDLGGAISTSVGRRLPKKRRAAGLAKDRFRLFQQDGKTVQPPKLRGVFGCTTKD